MQFMKNCKDRPNYVCVTKNQAGFSAIHEKLQKQAKKCHSKTRVVFQPITKNCNTWKIAILTTTLKTNMVIQQITKKTLTRPKSAFLQKKKIDTKIISAIFKNCHNHSNRRINFCRQNDKKVLK